MTDRLRAPIQSGKGEQTRPSLSGQQECSRKLHLADEIPRRAEGRRAGATSEAVVDDRCRSGIVRVPEHVDWLTPDEGRRLSGAKHVPRDDERVEIAKGRVDRPTLVADIALDEHGVLVRHQLDLGAGGQGNGEEGEDKERTEQHMKYLRAERSPAGTSESSAEAVCRSDTRGAPEAHR